MIPQSVSPCYGFTGGQVMMLMDLVPTPCCGGRTAWASKRRRSGPPCSRRPTTLSTRPAIPSRVSAFISKAALDDWPPFDYSSSGSVTSLPHQ
jgi:hypothetical protein